MKRKSNANAKKTFLALIMDMSKNGLMEWSAFDTGEQSKCGWWATWSNYTIKCTHASGKKTIKVEVWDESGMVIGFPVTRKEDREILQDAFWQAGPARAMLESMQGGLSRKTGEWDLVRAIKNPKSMIAGGIAFIQTWQTIGIANSIIYWRAISICTVYPDQIPEWVESAEYQAELHSRCGDPKGERAFRDLAVALRRAYRAHEEQPYQIDENYLLALIERMAVALNNIAEFAGTEAADNGETRILTTDWVREFAKTTLANLGIEVDKEDDTPELPSELPSEEPQPA